MMIAKFKASFNRQVVGCLGEYQPSKQAIASVRDLRQRLNVLAPVRLLASSVSKRGVSIHLRRRNPRTKAVHIDLTGNDTVITAANLAAALSWRDLATCVASVIDTVAGLPAPDADRAAALIFLKVTEYAPQYRLPRGAHQRPEPHPPPS
jgi:hypothetical protein